MPYHLHQGGRRRRRRRWPALVAVLTLLGAGVAAGLTLAPERADEPARPAAPAIEEPLAGGGPAPLAGGGTAPSPLSVRLDDPRDVVRLRFKRRPRSGLLFDLDTGRVLWRHDPTRVLPIASLTKMMTALLVARRVPPGSKVRITREALRYRGSGVGLLPPRPPRRGRDDAARAPAPVRQRRGDRARPAHERQREALRGADEPARRRRWAWPARTSPPPTDTSTAAPTPAPRTSPRSRARCCASRGWRGSCAAARPCCRSRSRAAGSTSTTTTRCCGRATAA